MASLLRSFARWGRSMLAPHRAQRSSTIGNQSYRRKPRFEQLEIRKVLSAAPPAPIHLGAVYLEPASGDDGSPNLIQVTFEGGAPGTQLTQLVINGDKDLNGKYSSGEVFFDTAAGGQGVFASSPLAIVQSTGFTVNSVHVEDGGQQIVFNLSGFVAGDKLVFSVDVDEVQFVDPIDGSFDVNAVVEGNEFQRSILTGSFAAPHFQNASGTAKFSDAFNDDFSKANVASGTTLNLPVDSYQPPSIVDQTDLTAGAVLVLPQTPLPITLAGTVFHDQNLSNSHDPSEQGIGNVTLTLLELDNGQWIPTGKSTTTDAIGNYKFDGLLPGTYRVVETQPAPWISVGSQVGAAEGVVDGTSVDPDTLSDIVLLGGDDGIHYNFGEALPASISGTVWADPQGDCVLGPSDIPLAGVQIDLLDAAGHVIRSTTTNTDGNYEFDGLAPGVSYGVFEHQPAGYYQGMAQVGSQGGVNSALDTISQVVLGSGVHGDHYDFCEELPASVAGHVWADPQGDCVFGPTDIPLAGVQIDLLDEAGDLVGTTTTNAQGQYQFDNLAPGTYSVFEHQPPGYYQGMAQPGSAGGVNSAVDLISQITLGSNVHGVNYDFCEELPASVAGHVWADPQGDCVFGPTDIPLPGVQIDLLDDAGNLVATTSTDSNGQYKFDNLAPGAYSVFEHQPAGYYQGMAQPGSAGGVNSALDLISQITLGSDVHAVNYDFCEELPGSISGRVHADTEGDCVIGPNDIMLAGVQVDLLDAQGNVVDTTTTDEQGYYEFVNLAPGTYGVHEHQPQGYFDDGGDVGSLGGAANDDFITQIVVGSGAHGTDYDFCEHIPNSISGYVHADPEGDCIIGPNDIMLSGVQIDLLDAAGHVLATTFTNAQGFYEFKNLDRGTYSVFEHQPQGYFDDGGDAGSLGGVVDDDLISQIVLVSDNHGTDYNFCEHLPNSIEGRVHLDPEGDCEFGPNDIPLAGVQVDLLDSDGYVVATATTSDQGFYKFDGLDSGTYAVRQHAPPQYFDDGGEAGSLGGVANGDLISQIAVISDDHGLNYDFCLHPASSISGYVFQDGPPIVLAQGQTKPDVAALRDGRRTSDDKPIAGVTLLLYDAAGQPIRDSNGQQLRAVTDARGFYQFTHLRDGHYLVRELQPGGYIDGIDTPGTTGGVAINSGATQTAVGSLPFDPNFDVIAAIPLTIGQDSKQNNFSEVVAQPTTLVPPLPLIDILPPPSFLATGVPNEFLNPLVQPLAPQPPVLRFAGAEGVGYTWHLSIVDAGFPRGPRDGQVAIDSSSVPVEIVAWADRNTIDGDWIVLDATGHEVHRRVRGVKHGTAIAGDFRGDGQEELAFFVDGEWFIDLNGNGRLDAADLWAKLGTRDDQPVVGDWNGDGKDDIGIFGPAWPRDPQAIQVDRGLPDPMNNTAVNGHRKKNVPPTQDEAPFERRRMQVSDHTAVREDLIDHVFHYGTPAERAIAGDWTGSGLRRIGVFRNGAWYLDLDGDGRTGSGDLQCTFGQAGDLPVVGDWTGDGIEKIGVYRNGTWHLDTNNNHQLDAGDIVVHLGQPGDQPVVGKTNSGRAEIGVYRPSPAPVSTAATPDGADAPVVK